MRFSTFFMSVLLLSQMAGAQDLFDQISTKFIPESFKVDPVTKKKNSIGDGIGVHGQSVDLDNSKKNDYWVLLYTTDVDTVPVCKVRVVKTSAKIPVLMGETVINEPDILAGCTEVESRDLDRDGKPEIIVKTEDRVEETAPVIFRWNGKNLIDITPTESGTGKARVNMFRTVAIAEDPVKGKTLIMDIDPQGGPSRTFEMRDGKIQLVEQNEFVAFLGLHPKSYATVKTQVKVDGTYKLKIKNVSDNAQKTVRVEVADSKGTLLKPRDFCKADPPKATGKPVNDGDGNEDKLKGCPPKGDVEVPVTLKQGTDLKVKVFGATGSKIQITLNKK